MTEHRNGDDVEPPHGDGSVRAEHGNGRLVGRPTPAPVGRPTPPPVGPTEHPAGHPAGRSSTDEAVCRFELAPPRRFVYPVVLLLVTEEPMHGYRLVGCLRALHYGSVNRPNVYRALADLEHDGLLESWAEKPDAGSTRRVYGITDAGRSQLAGWMEVIAGERAVLDRVLARFSSVDGSDQRPLGDPDGGRAQGRPGSRPASSEW